MELTYKQRQIHERALRVVGKYFEIEAELIDILQEVEQSKLYHRLNLRSPFQYATKILKLSDSVAYYFIAVARKARLVPELKTAIVEKKISVSKASKIVANLSSENARELIDLAAKKSAREVEAEMAHRFPGQVKPERVKFIDSDHVEITMTISKSDLANLERAGSLESQKGKTLSRGKLVGLALETHLEKFDPIRKAQRAVRKAKSRNEKLHSHDITRPSEEPQPHVKGVDRKTAPSTDLSNAKKNSSREEFNRSIRAEVLHLIYRRDGGGCIHHDESGRRCGSDRWVQFHHIVPVSEGGSSELENLATLCSFHHRLVHQMRVPRLRQREWMNRLNPLTY